VSLTHLSLFSGIGGLDLAAEWAGFETVGQCEWADYPTKVLEKHWPDVPRWRDIRTLTKESFYERTGRATVDVISGGFPCQPFSVAGKQKGKEDNRYLWPEMLRVIRELKPHYVVGENVPGIINIAADEVCADLEREGYEVRIFNFEAAAVGAPHRRARVAFVAHAKRDGFSGCKGAGSFDEAVSEEQAGQDNTLNTTGAGGIRRDVANTDSEGLQRGCKARNACGERENIYKQSTGCGNGREWWATEPDVGRVAHGIPNRVDRIKALGNAVVPQQFYPIFKAISDAEYRPDHDGITVTGDPYPGEIEGYVRRGLREHGKRLTAMEITLDGADCDIHYILERPFERIRRITGYLVGTTDRFNNAKQAEEHDRVKHSIRPEKWAENETKAVTE
jgi:DNA (cytosine-5)-methyltransferase 1